MRDDELAALERETFIDLFGSVYEHSAWIAERAFAHAPFRSFAAVGTAMEAVLDAAGEDAALALVRAHPDLAGRAALSGSLTRDSRQEQAASGLTSLTFEELERFTRLNEAYKMKFGFPFVMAVRNSEKAAILAAFERRLAHDGATELRTAIAEIKTIARLRIEAMANG